MVANQPREDRGADEAGPDEARGPGAGGAGQGGRPRCRLCIAGERRRPGRLQKALDASPKAAEFWAGLNKSNRYAIIFQLEDAKKPETRVRRLAKFVAMLERGEKLY